MGCVYYAGIKVEVWHADCLDVMASIEDSSVDSIVTDPPYGLEFMGRSWDSYVGPVAYQEWCRAWATHALRILKPGGHLLAFGGTRTHHRLMSGIEDAGFEIRDSITWLYGSGFPKSLDVGKAIDKSAGMEREVIGNTATTSGRTVGRGTSPGHHGDIVSGHCRDITAPATDDAKKWHGYGTALKPAGEVIVMARKALAEKTVAANVLTHGTGAINVDGCRVGTDGGARRGSSDLGVRGKPNDVLGAGLDLGNAAPRIAGLGRWPANVVLSHVEAEDGGDACADGCVEGGEVTTPGYAYASGDVAVAHGDDPAFLLGRLDALLRGWSTSSTSGTTLWRGAAGLYGSGGIRLAADGSDPAHAVRRALRLTEPEDSPGGCQSCRGSDDERVRRVLAAVRDGLPSLADALAAESRQLAERERSHPVRLIGHQSSLGDAPHGSSPCSTPPNNEADAGPPPSSLALETTAGSQDIQRPASGPEGCPDSTQACSTDATFGSPETTDHTPCIRATCRLLTFLAFDIASRFVTPGQGIHPVTVVTNLPQCAVAELDGQAQGSQKQYVKGPPGGTTFGGGEMRATEGTWYGDRGGASRYFPTFRYTAKAPTSERPKVNGIAHPTCKPLALMQWLTRLVTPPGGLVLDPFAGSGTTVEACIAEGFRCIAVESEAEYMPLIDVRIARAEKEKAS